MFANKNQKDYPEKIFKLHFMFADVTSFFLRLSVNSKEVYPSFIETWLEIAVATVESGSFTSRNFTPFK